jgi:hypothetical protein
VAYSFLYRPGPFASRIKDSPPDDGAYFIYVDLHRNIYSSIIQVGPGPIGGARRVLDRGSGPKTPSGNRVFPLKRLNFYLSYIENGLRRNRI